MKFFVNQSKLLQILCLFAFAFPAAHAAGPGPCQGFLSPEFESMLRDFNIKEDLYHFATENSPDTRLFMPFLHIHNFLKSESFTEVRTSTVMAGQIGEEFYDRVRNSEFFTLYPEYYSPEAARTFFVLSHSFESGSVSNLDLGVMSYLFRNLLTGEGLALVAPWNPLEPNIEKLKTLLANERNRNVIDLFMQTRDAAFFLVEYVTQKNVNLPGVTPKSVVKRLRSNRLSPNDLKVVAAFFSGFIDILSQSRLEGGPPVSVTAYGQTLINHEPFAAAASSWANHNLPADAQEEFVRMLQYLVFNVPLPNRLQAFRTAYLDGGAKIFASMKQDHKAVLVEQQRAKLALPPQPMAPVASAVATQPLPVPQIPNPAKRKNQTAEEKPTPVPETVRPVESQIPEELKLKHFGPDERDASFTPITQLKADTPYFFTFKRPTEQKVGVQSVVFDRLAVKFLNRNPQLARAIIRVFIRGSIRDDQAQNGLKILHLPLRTPYPGRVWEIKTKSSWRALVIYTNNHWQILDVVPKNQVTTQARMIPADGHYGSSPSSSSSSGQ